MKLTAIIFFITLNKPIVVHTEGREKVLKTWYTGWSYTHDMCSELVFKQETKLD